MLFFDIGFYVNCTTATALQAFKCWLAAPLKGVLNRISNIINIKRFILD